MHAILRWASWKGQGLRDFFCAFAIIAFEGNASGAVESIVETRMFFSICFGVLHHSSAKGTMIGYGAPLDQAILILFAFASPTLLYVLGDTRH